MPRRVLTGSPHSTAPAVCVPPLSGAREHILLLFATLWLVLRWLWIALLLGLVLLASLGAYAGTRAFVSSLPTLSVATIPRSPWAVALALVVVVLALVSLYAAMAAWYQRRRRSALLASEYILRPVRKLLPARFVPRYVASVYIPRTDAPSGLDADATARVAVRSVAERERVSAQYPLGICIYGGGGQGKTRLAWEVMRAELTGWTFVRWPRDPRVALDAAAVAGRRVVIWLDDVHQLATPTEGATLNDLPRWLAEHAQAFVILATCRDGQNEVRARRHLGSLLQRLIAIRPADLSPDEGGQLVAALEKEGIAVQRDQFVRTPGSLLLELPRLRREVYPALSDDARRVAQALKLLRSAHLYVYPESRVRATASDLFALDAAAWPAALAELEAAGFLRSSGSTRAGVRLVVPVAEVYLDDAVPDYLTANAEPSDDWPWLQESFERSNDVVGLIGLGTAFTEVLKGLGPLVPYSLRLEKQRGVISFRAALEQCSLRSAPLLWARAQLEFAQALSARAELSEGLLRADFWRQALAAYSSALEVFTWEAAPAHWAVLHLGLACLYESYGGDALVNGDVETACQHFREGRRHARCALSFYTPETDPAHYREVVSVRDALEYALVELGCYMG